MSDFALDASAALAWCFGAEGNAASQALLERLLGGAVAEVPAVWFLEIANVLAVAERRRALSAAEIVEAVTLYASLPVHVDDSDIAHRGFGDILALARGQQLTSYDAAYLDVAMRGGLPLATRDNALKAAARRVGVRLIAC